MKNIEDDKILLKILDELQNEHDSHTAILYGSRARGDENPASDYDVLALRDKEPNIVVAKLVDGAYCDAFVYSDSYALAHAAEFLHIRGGRVLFQRGNQGTKLISQVEAIYRKGPTPLTPDKIEQKKVWIDKSLMRAQRGDTEALYRRHWLLFALLEDYFALRGLWYRGPKESFRYLAEHDTHALKLFELALGANARDADLKKLGEAVKGSPRL